MRCAKLRQGRDLGVEQKVVVLLLALMAALAFSVLPRSTASAAPKKCARPSPQRQWQLLSSLAQQQLRPPTPIRQTAWWCLNPSGGDVDSFARLFAATSSRILAFKQINQAGFPKQKRALAALFYLQPISRHTPWSAAATAQFAGSRSWPAAATAA